MKQVLAVRVGAKKAVGHIVSKKWGPTVRDSAGRRACAPLGPYPLGTAEKRRVVPSAAGAGNVNLRVQVTRFLLDVSVYPRGGGWCRVRGYLQQLDGRSSQPFPGKFSSSLCPHHPRWPITSTLPSLLPSLHLYQKGALGLQRRRQQGRCLACR